MYDEISVSFENAAMDSMGYDHVEGKLYCGRDALELQFKTRDRAFRKSELNVVSFTYNEIEKTEYVSKWFRPRILVFQTRHPEKLADFPGASVGRVELQVVRSSRKNASKVADWIVYKQSEAFVAESETRLNRMRTEEG